jgi:hypothetical protein
MPEDRPETDPPAAPQPSGGGPTGASDPDSSAASGVGEWSPAPTVAGHHPRTDGAPTGAAWSPSPGAAWSPSPGAAGPASTGGDRGSPAPEPPHRRPIGLALALITVGVVWLLALAGVSLPWELLVPAALIVTGVLVLLSSRWRGGTGLIGFGIALAIVALLVAVPSPAALSAGDRTIAVTDVADLEDRYGLGAGTMTLDLRELELPPGTTEIEAGVNLGELVVVVPPDVSVTGEGRIFLGEIEHFDRTSGGIAPRAAFAEPGDDRILELRLRVGLGQIEVRR